MATAGDNCLSGWPRKKKLRNIILKKIPWQGSSKIEQKHLPEKARISLNVCKLEDVSSTNTTKILIMIIMKSKNAVAYKHTRTLLLSLHL